MSLVGAGLVLVGAALAMMAWMSSPPNKIVRATFNKIQPGMSAADVEHLIGARPGKHGPPRRLGDNAKIDWGVYDSDPNRHMRWSGNDGDIDVCLNQFGLVIGASFVFHSDAAPPIWTRTLRLFGL
jgi:hypothetical protein